MASIAVLVGGGEVVNTLAFSGSDYLFSHLQGSKVDKEWKRHDLAVERLMTTQQEWSQWRTQCLNFINEQLRWQNHSVQTFQDADQAMHEYSLMTGSKPDPVGAEPQLTDYYMPLESQKDREIAFVIARMAVVGLVL